MTKAEETALEAYPCAPSELNTFEHQTIAVDSNSRDRRIYLCGYEQAEKDLALTKDDVWCIFNLVRELQTKYPATEGCLQEVADIFNEQRKK